MRRHSDQSFLLIERIQTQLPCPSNCTSDCTANCVYNRNCRTWKQLEECSRVAEMLQSCHGVGCFKFNSLKLRSRRPRTQSKKAKPSRLVNLKRSSIGRELSKVLKTVFRASAGSQAVRTINATEKAMKKPWKKKGRGDGESV